MEGNFESGGGVSGGSSMPDPGGTIEFDSGGSLTDAGDFSSSNSNLTHLDYLKDGVDKGYYQAEAEGIYSIEDVMSEAQEEMSENDKESEWDVMDIPGTAHEKLETLAQANDEDIYLLEKGEESEPKLSAEDKEGVEDQAKDAENIENKENQPSFEQQVIKLQAEAIKLMAEGMNSKVKEKDLEELLKKLKKLLNELEKGKDVKGSKKTTLLSGVFTAITLLLEMGEEGYRKLEHEVKEAER